MTKKQTPLTYELFEELIMPEIKTLISESHSELEEKISHLPSKEEFYSKMDEVVTELKKSRENNDLVNHQYSRTNKRVDIIDKHLGIDTSTVF